MRVGILYSTQEKGTILKRFLTEMTAGASVWLLLENLNRSGFVKIVRNPIQMQLVTCDILKMSMIKLSK